MDKLNLLTNNQKTALFLLIVLPVVAYFLAKSSVEDDARKRFRRLREVQMVTTVSNKVSSNEVHYIMLSEVPLDYRPRAILQGFSPAKYAAYFNPNVSIGNVPSMGGRGGGSGSGAPVAPPKDAYPEKLSFIYVGENNSYAILDGRLVTEGDSFSGLTVETIESNRVLLKGKRSQKWITLKF